MNVLLLMTAPLIYILIILFSAWLGLMNGRQRRGVSAQPIIAILAGLSVCPLVAVFMQFGRLNVPSIEIVLPLVCLTLGIGFIVGLIYIWAAGLVLDHAAETSLFVLATIGGSAICLYFYFFYQQVQELLISSAWGFLFGVLVYMVIKGPRDTISRFSR